jgi:lysophospholipase L1-like esterase
MSTTVSPSTTSAPTRADVAPAGAQLSRKRAHRRKLFKLLSFVACYVALELVCALLYKRILSPAERGGISPLRNNTYNRINNIPHPYTLITLNPESRDYGEVQNNSLGFRSPETTVPKPPGVFRIFCLGGSTTYGTSVHKPEQAYPAQLGDFLRERTGNPKIEVINAGISYASSFEVLSTFLYRVLPLEPDLVIVDASLNDVEPLLLPDYAEDYTHWRRNWVRPAAPPWLRLALHSPMFSFFYAKLAQPHTQAASYQKTLLNVHNLESLELSPAVKARKPTAFRRNMENLILVAKGRGIKVMLVTGKNKKPIPHVDWVLALHRQVDEELSKKYDVPVCDFYHRAQIADDHWVNAGGEPDINHLDAAGERLKAELIGGDVLSHFGSEIDRRAPGSGSTASRF